MIKHKHMPNGWIVETSSSIQIEARDQIKVKTCTDHGGNQIQILPLMLQMLGMLKKKSTITMTHQQAPEFTVTSLRWSGISPANLVVEKLTELWCAAIGLTEIWDGMVATACTSKMSNALSLLEKVTEEISVNVSNFLNAFWYNFYWKFPNPWHT